MKKLLNGSELLNAKINEMVAKVVEYETLGTGIKKKTANGYKRTIPFLRALETACYDNDVMLDVRSTDNLGVITEAVVKALLGKGNSKSGARETDLITGGKRFEIKLLIKGSSSYPSSLDLETEEDVLVISNLGAYILRNADIKTAYKQGYFKAKENKLKPTILDSGLLTETAFTERLTSEWALNTWV